jgi:hypothetical protein
MKAKFRPFRATYCLHLLQYRLEVSKLLLQRPQHLTCGWFACVKITMIGTSHRLKYCTAFVVHRFIICKCGRGLHNTPWTDTRDPRTGGGNPSNMDNILYLKWCINTRGFKRFRGSFIMTHSVRYAML